MIVLLYTLGLLFVFFLVESGWECQCPGCKAARRRVR